MNKCVSFLLVALAILAVVGCRDKHVDATDAKEDKEAEAMLQGIWVDNDTEEVTFKVKNDTIFYPDSTSLPTVFKIYGDTLVLGNSTKYPIVKQAKHLFWFKNQNGDVIKLKRSDDPDDADIFVHETPHALEVITHVVKKDSVVMYNGERYHWYIAINPTKYKVVRTAYNSDGVGVDNVYYDNIIHVSIFKGAEQIYSRDIKKQMYRRFVPHQFLSQSILSNMGFSHVDAHGFHFDSTICMPDGASCYMLDTNISFGGKLKMELLEY